MQLLFHYKGFAIKGMVVDIAVHGCKSVEIVSDVEQSALKTIEEGNWPQRLALPSDTQGVTIKARNCSKQNTGILASFSNGIVTDGSWRCADSTSCNWTSNDCSNVTWENASVVTNSVYSTPHRRSTSEIASNAQWIWIGHSFAINVWCEKTFGMFNKIFFRELSLFLIM